MLYYYYSALFCQPLYFQDFFIDSQLPCHRHSPSDYFMLNKVLLKTMEIRSSEIKNLLLKLWHKCIGPNCQLKCNVDKNLLFEELYLCRLLEDKMICIDITMFRNMPEHSEIEYVVWVSSQCIQSVR